MFATSCLRRGVGELVLAERLSPRRLPTPPPQPARRGVHRRSCNEEDARSADHDEAGVNQQARTAFDQSEPRNLHANWKAFMAVLVEDPSLPSYTGHFTVWGGFNANGKTVNGTFVSTSGRRLGWFDALEPPDRPPKRGPNTPARTSSRSATKPRVLTARRGASPAHQRAEPVTDSIAAAGYWGDHPARRLAAGSSDDVRRLGPSVIILVNDFSALNVRLLTTSRRPSTPTSAPSSG